MTHFPKINHIHNSSLSLHYVCVLIYVIGSVVSYSNRDLRKSCILCFLLGSHTRMWNQFLHEQCFLYDFFPPDMTSAALFLALWWLVLCPVPARFIVLWQPVSYSVSQNCSVCVHEYLCICMLADIPASLCIFFLLVSYADPLPLYDSSYTIIH